MRPCVRKSAGVGEVIMARETAPKQISEDICAPRNFTDPATIAVPGEIRGYALAHQRHGRLPWARLFEPAIDLAERGVPVTRSLREWLEFLNNLSRSVQLNKPLCAIYCGEDGNILKENDVLKHPSLAKTYRAIAELGPQEFYAGSVARRLVRDVKAAGGVLELSDLKEYKAEVLSPLLFPFGEDTILLPPLPGGGISLAFALNILQGYEMTQKSMEPQNRAQTFHQLAGALKFVSKYQDKLGDPQFKNMSQLVRRLLSPEFAAKVRSAISGQTDVMMTDRPGTSHMSVLAPDGSAVSVTSSINTFFGSRVVSSSTGVILNDHMRDFCNNKSLPQPGERPISSMSPAIILDKSKRVKMVVGASGGTLIIAGIVQVIMNTLRFGYDLEKAVMTPRLYVGRNVTINLEDDFDKDVGLQLERLGHLIGQTQWKSVVQAIHRSDSGIVAKSDERKYAQAAGF
uniref:glutathione hydrolase 1 proenzyme-like isoform X3 n=1 Tax=Myxine glutinosa TaxID=7769 RepID=UPI00358F462B